MKLQILNLAAKLCITNSKQTKLLCQYVFNLAKYDLSYDIRDRTRLLRQLILPGDKSGMLSKHVKKIFFATKPAPLVNSRFSGELASVLHNVGNSTQQYFIRPIAFHSNNIYMTHYFYKSLNGQETPIKSRMVSPSWEPPKCSTSCMLASNQL